MSSNEPLCRFEFHLTNGETLIKEFFMLAEASSSNLESPPEWLVNISRSWPHPQDPVVLSGDVREGCDDEARAWIADSGPS